MNTTTFEDATITALGHDGFRVDIAEPQLTIVFDPYDIKTNDGNQADYIFISHRHFDHCDPASIRTLMGPNTKVIAPKSCADELAEFADHAEFVEDDQKHETKHLTYWTIPAYNINKFRTPNEVFHPREMGGVGFIAEINKLRFYHAGDTDMIPEMENLKKISVAFLPISGTFVMTLDEAIKAAELIKPDLVIPMHFGKILGSVGDANRFQNLLRDKVSVTVLSAENA